MLDGIRDGLVHQGCGAVDLPGGQVRAVLQQIALPFGVDLLTPSRPEPP